MSARPHLVSRLRSPAALLAALALSACASAAPAPTAGAPATPAGTRGSTPVLAETRAADPALVARLQAKLDSLHAAGSFPGLTAGFALPDGTVFALAVGQSDTARDVPMRPDDRMLSGSVGKTYAAAVALQLVAEGKIRLDEKVSAYLGSEPWFSRLPNAADVTVRQLMNHTSGLVRYELDPRFLRDLTAAPRKAWTGPERLAYLFDARPPFAAGEGWDYSDTNYIVLGMIVERVAGRGLNELIAERVLRPHGLANTLPSDRPRITGLVQGYAGPGNPFGGADAMLGPDGEMTINPQFEWAGGGYASAAADLARWAKRLYEGKAFDPALLPQVLDGVPAPMLGPGARYGLGVIVRETPLGPAYGHSGFFPGYMAEMRYFPRLGLAVSVQTNTSVPRSLGRPLGAILQELAQIAASHAAARPQAFRQKAPRTRTAR